MMLFSVLIYIMVPMASATAKNFKVFHNPVDPTVLRQSQVANLPGGAYHNGTGDGNVNAVTVCVRFQVSLALKFSKTIFQKRTHSHTLQRQLVTNATRA